MKNGFEISEGTYAFYREGDEVVEVAQCHPDFYCTRVDGVYRNPLPPLSDREFVSFRDAEDEMIARIDGDVPTDEELELLGYDDLADEEHDRIELAELDMVDADRPVVRIPAFAALPASALPAGPDPVVIRRRLGKAATIVTEAESLPTAVSARRAVLDGPKTVLKETGPDDHSWKGNTKNGRQFSRHH